MVPVRRHARHWGAYVAVGITAAALLLFGDAVGQVVNGDHAKGSASQQYGSASDQPPSAQSTATASDAAPHEDEHAANLTSGQNSPGTHDGDGFWNAKITDWAIVFLTFGLLAVGATQAEIYRQQARLMRAALRATSRSNRVAARGAKAAEDAVAKSDEMLVHVREAAQQDRESTRRMERAYLFADWVK